MKWKIIWIWSHGASFLSQPGKPEPRALHLKNPCSKLLIGEYNMNRICTRLIAGRLKMFSSPSRLLNSCLCCSCSELKSQTLQGFCRSRWWRMPSISHRVTVFSFTNLKVGSSANTLYTLTEAFLGSANNWLFCSPLWPTKSLAPLLVIPKGIKPL